MKLLSLCKPNDLSFYINTVLKPLTEYFKIRGHCTLNREEELTLKVLVSPRIDSKRPDYTCLNYGVVHLKENDHCSLY